MLTVFNLPSKELNITLSSFLFTSGKLLHLFVHNAVANKLGLCNCSVFNSILLPSTFKNHCGWVRTYFSKALNLASALLQNQHQTFFVPTFSCVAHTTYRLFFTFILVVVFFFLMILLTFVLL